MDWLQHLGGFQGTHIKRTLFELLKERYIQNERIIDRLSGSINNNNDVKDFFKLVTDLYELGYLKAVNDHKEQLRKIGLIANIVPEKKN